MKLLLATRNQDKIREIRAVLQDLPVDLLTVADLPSPVPEVEEDGATLQENAIKKARALYEATGLPALADDTGLEVEALSGAPGIYSSRYSGEGASYEDNVRKLLRELEGVPRERRQARFRTVVALVSQAGVQTVEGVVEGVITFEPCGDSNFGYDPVFYVPEAGKTMAQMSLAEKNRISHRARALAKLKDLLKHMAQQNKS